MCLEWTDGKGTDHLRGALTGQRRWRNGFMTEEEERIFFLFWFFSAGQALALKSLDFFPDIFCFNRPMGRVHTGMATVKRPRPDGRVK